jgi:hypothetical protein
MRAASNFTRVRLYVDVSGRSHHLESWDKTTSSCCWTAEGGLTYLSTGVSFGYGAVTAAPPNTQTTIDQAPECTDNADPPVAIENTACVMFNSRGVPIDAGSFAPTALDALYLTDGVAVYGVTLPATGMLKMSRTQNTATPNWVLN